MAIKLYKQPELEKPALIVGWPGIGNIGIIAVDTLRDQLRASNLASNFSERVPKPAGTFHSLP